jgi:hypothetical protein
MRIDLFKKIGIALIVLLIAPTAVSRLMGNADPIASLIALIVLSITAYLIRERRLRRSERPRRSGRAERTPVLPRGEDEV